MLTNSSCCSEACPGQHQSLGWLTPAVHSQIPASSLGLSGPSKPFEQGKKREEAILQERRPESRDAPAEGTCHMCNSKDVECAACASLLQLWSSVEGVLEVRVC